MKKAKKAYADAIKNWPESDRPREKLFNYGEHNLSDSELLAILFCSGTKGQSAVDLARRVLKKFNTFRKMSRAELSDWMDFKGLGIAKVAQIRAAIEIGRRFREEEIKECRPKIKSSEDVVKVLMPRMRDLRKEVFKIFLLDSQNRVIDLIEVEEGTVNQANPIIREVFHRAVQNFAASIICVHNHPSGDPKPSQEDKVFTQEMVQAGQILQIRALDHIIIGDNRYFSFVDEGLM